MIRCVFPCIRLFSMLRFDKATPLSLLFKSILSEKLSNNL